MPRLGNRSLALRMADPLPHWLQAPRRALRSTCCAAWSRRRCAQVPQGRAQRNGMLRQALAAVATICTGASRSPEHPLQIQTYKSFKNSLRSSLQQLRWIRRLIASRKRARMRPRRCSDCSSLWCPCCSVCAGPGAGAPARPADGGAVAAAPGGGQAGRRWAGPPLRPSPCVRVCAFLWFCACVASCATLCGTKACASPVLPLRLVPCRRAAHCLLLLHFT